MTGYGIYQIPEEGFVEAYPRPDHETFKNYLLENLRYPEEALKNKIEGRVILNLSISVIGEILDIEVKRSLGYGCDEEAVRLVREGPIWNPASSDGTSVKTKVRVRVNFKLD